jgi:CRP/FNR family transcriptional regulator
MDLGPKDHSAYALQEFPVCGALAPYELDALVKICIAVSFSPRQTVFFEGDEAKSFFIVRSGAASACKSLGDGRRQVTGFLYPADFCGLAIGGRYANSVEAITNLTLYRFARRQSDSLLETFPKLQRRMLSQAGNELATAQEQLVLLGRKTAT